MLDANGRSASALDAYRWCAEREAASGWTSTEHEDFEAYLEACGVRSVPDPASPYGRAKLIEVSR